MRRLAFMVLLSIALISCNRSGIRKVPKIGILQDRPQEWADALKIGFNEGLEAEGIRIGEDVIVVSRSADGDPVAFSTIADVFARGEYNLAYTLGTQASQEQLSRSKTMNIIFGAVTDPVAARLVGQDGRRLGNLTGSQDLWPYEDQFNLIQAIRPVIDAIGIIYNPAEANSVVSVKLIREQCVRRHLKLLERAATSDAEVVNAVAATIAGGARLVFIPADNTAQAAAGSIINLCDQRRVPVFTGISGIVQQGAIGTVGTDYVELGRVNAKQAVEILKHGKRAGDIPISVATRGEVYLNLTAAKRLGLTIPSEWTKRAVKVY